MAMPNKTAVQSLYELCNQTFSPQGGVPPLSAVHTFTARLDTIRSEDVGLDEAAIVEIERHGVSCSCCSTPNKRRRLHRRAGGSRSIPTPPVTYIQVHECATFSIGVFCLPASAMLPLHDHSQMVVFSKILYGSMHVKAYDWLDPPPTPHPFHWKLAGLKTDNVFEAPCEASVLYPTTGGNIHSFRAITSCAVLDVLSPPYSGVNPSYYREHPRLSLTGDGGEAEEGVWLEKVETPENLVIRIEAYKGPAIEVT